MQGPRIWQLEPTKGSDEALIIVRGFRGEGSFRAAIEDYWMLSIREVGWQGSIYYLWWDASDPDGLNNILAVPKWRKSKDRAKRVGAIDFKHLVKEVPEKSISLIGHSLGARVIYYALKEWSSTTTKEIKDVILLGGAVRENKDWQYASSKLRGCVFNLYNSKDPVLKTTYKVGEFFFSSDPCGLTPIENTSSKIANLNVTSIVGNSHSEPDYIYALKENRLKIWKEDSDFSKVYNVVETIFQKYEIAESNPSQAVRDAENLRQKLEEMDKVQVSVALFGQPGAGKSSLINCLTGKKQAEVGIKNDVTVEEQSYEWNGLHLVDLPGYSTTKFPASTYMERFNIEKFDFFLCVFSGVRLKEDDIAFFKNLKQTGKSYLFVCNKVDALWEDGKTLSEIQEEVQENLRQEVGIQDCVYFISCRNEKGLDELTEGILRVLGSISESKQERWTIAAKAYSPCFLEDKKKACQKHIVMAAGASAANGVNLIPGIDIAIDLWILEDLFKKIRACYGLEEDQTKKMNTNIPKFASAAKKVSEYATKKGILLLIKKFIGRSAAKQASKYIPFVGPAIAASIGFSVTLAAGNSYLDDCHQLAEAMLSEDLN